MTANDFRRGDLAPEFSVSNAKDAFERELMRSHPRSSNTYVLVSGNPEYKKRLANAYGNRCAYCGVPVGVVPLDNCEIDHILCEDEGRGFEIVGDTNGLNNLALACHFCNTSKRAFSLYGDHFGLLSPDLGLGATFCRGNLYEIEINAEYSSNAFVNAFYEKMKYGSSLRRLDYLLANMMDLIQHIEKREELLKDVRDDVLESLRAALWRLVEKRNSSVYDTRKG